MILYTFNRGPPEAADEGSSASYSAADFRRQRRP